MYDSVRSHSGNGEESRVTEAGQWLPGPVDRGGQCQGHEESSGSGGNVLYLDY